MGYYEIINEFTAGMVVGMTGGPREMSWSDHRLAGFDAGYAMRKDKNERIDKYLVSIGQRPQATVKLA